MNFEKVDVWLPPFWLIGMGAFAGLVLLALGYGAVWLVSRRAALSLREAATEGVMPWILGFSVVVATVSAAGTFFVEKPLTLLASVPQLLQVDSAQVGQTIAAHGPPQKLNLPFAIDRISRLTISCDGDITIRERRAKSGRVINLYPLTNGRTLVWTKPSGLRNPLYRTDSILWVTNTSGQNATLAIEANVDVDTPQSRLIVVTSVGLIAIVLIYLAIRILLPTISTIAMATSREVISQKLFWLVLILGVILLKPLLLPIPSLMYLPYNTFGEDIKMLRDTGVTVVMVLSIVIAIWSAGVSISEELEGRTALTLLSKPVSRRQFIIGKYVGIVWVVGLMFLVLGTLLLLTVSCKVVYDARDLGTLRETTWIECYQEMVVTTPALVLGFLETVVLASVSVALSTKLPVLANLIVSTTVYALGHLVPLVVVSSEGKFPVVTFIGQLIAVVLPVLDHFSVPGATIGGEAVPLAYLAWAGLYSLLYSSIAILIALAFFENRDLA